MCSQTSTTATAVLVVGFTLVTRDALDRAYPGRCVLWVEEPDVIAKRRIAEHVKQGRRPGELTAWEYMRPGAAERFVRAFPQLDVAAVVPGVEYAVPFAARLAELLGLPGAGTRAAHVLRDKSQQRRLTAAAGVRNPRSFPVGSLTEAVSAVAEIGGPAVLKPANRQGSVGTELVRDADDLPAAWTRCQRQDEGVMVHDRPFPVRMLVEELVTGEEYSVEMVVADGEVLFSNVTRKHLFDGVFPVERGHVVPAGLVESQRDELYAATRRVLAAVGFGTGIVHCEWIIRDGVPHLVECAGRMPGDGIADLVRLAWDADMYAAGVEALSGRRPKLPQQPRQGAAVWFTAAAPGRVTGVHGLEQARALPGVQSVTVSREVGDLVPELRDSWGRSASAVAVARTGEEALRVAQRAAGSVQVDTTADGDLCEPTVALAAGQR